jgi:hypothetical protein
VKVGNEPGRRRAAKFRNSDAHFALLLLAQIAVCCLSLTCVMRLYGYTGLFMFDQAQLGAALLITAPIFSFGYFAGFGFFTLILGFLWLTRCLPARFTLLSSGMLVQVLFNLPLAIGIMTYGGALLFLLWYVMPRTIFEQLT